MFRKSFIVLCISLFLCVGVLAQERDTSTDSAPTAEKKTEPKRPPIFRPTKDQIKQVQAILREKKLYSAEPSGKYDDETRAGIRAFQNTNGLKETGTLNRATLEKFGVELTDSQKNIPVNPNSYADRGGADRSTKEAPEKVVSGGSAENKPKQAPPFRANKEQITAAQKLLKRKSMYSGEETGKFSDDFREGLRKFQEANGMKITGTLNAATLQKMGIELTDSQKRYLSQ